MLTKEQMEVVAGIVSQKTLEFLEKEKQKQNKSKHDRRLRNTKLLLRQYRSLCDHCADLEQEIQDEDMSQEVDNESLTVKSIKESKVRTLKMVRFIRRMLESYQLHCEKRDDIRRWKTVEMLYLADEPVKAEEVAECHKVDVRTVYRDVNDACETLSVLMFGIDGIRFHE